MTAQPSKHVYAVILAGGSGTRFWPRSRQLRPKQLCSIGHNDKTMLELTLERLDNFVAPENRFIVTHQLQYEKTHALTKDHVLRTLKEPCAKNTGPALVLAALELHKHDPEAVMVSLHADHVIQNLKGFQDSFALAAATAAKHESIVLIGIKPSYPETAYGYIEKGADVAGEEQVFHVGSFREKPELAVAEEYVGSGRFLWNAGLFAWKVSTIIAEMQQHMPETLEQLSQLLTAQSSFSEVEFAALDKTYSNLESIAIDHAILEKSENIVAIEADIGWQDVGSWDALPKSFATDAHGNYVSGDTLTLDTKNCVVDTDGPMIATVGLEDTVIVVSDGVVLACPKDRAQDVKSIVAELKAKQRTELL